jgi:hypothetical protein
MVQLRKGTPPSSQYIFTNKRIPNDTDVRHGIHPLSPPNTFLQTRELKTKLRYEYSTA